MAGLRAVRISVSGFAESSECQKAISSQIAATIVYPGSSLCGL
jgi:hypothetical protein